MTYEDFKNQQKIETGEAYVVAVPNGRATTWDEEHERVTVLADENARLREANVGLRAKVAELRVRLAELEGGALKFS